MNFSPVEWRKHFPLLTGRPELHYLDNAATAQICAAALEAVVSFETRSRANVLRRTGGAHVDCSSMTPVNPGG